MKDHRSTIKLSILMLTFYTLSLISPSGPLPTRIANASSPETWAATGSMSDARWRHSATLLPNGRVLVAGGLTSNHLATAELYDPSSSTWSFAAQMVDARSYHTATLLKNGKVLVAGGGGGPSGTLTSAELYDPDTGTWTTTGSMAVSRYKHKAILLSDGRVLVAGGWNGSTGGLASAEIYNPTTGMWSMTGSMKAARLDHVAVLLPDDKVLVTGGSFNTSELFDPATGTWNWTAGSMNANRAGPSITLLPNNKVLVAGGASGGIPARLASAELYNPDTGTWTTTGSMTTGRWEHSGTLLPDGKVLVAGGQDNNTQPTTSAEIYDPTNGMWGLTGGMNTARRVHAAVLLSNNYVLAIGGYNGNYLSSAELYELKPATPSTYSVSGHITDIVSSNPIINVTVINSIGQVAITDSNGRYEFTSLASGTYTITPSKDGYTFIPPSLSVPVASNVEDADFTGGTYNPVIDYFALGDSIASGHGLMDDGSACHLSTRAYPHKVDAELKKRYTVVNFFPLACSGATAGLSGPVGENPLKLFRSQMKIMRAKLSDNPALVSISIGIDDIAWSDPLEMADALFIKTDKEFANWVRSNTKKIAANVKRELDLIPSQYNVSVVITLYHNPVNRSSRFFTLVPKEACAIRTLDCYLRTEILVTDLNRQLTTLEQPGRVKVTESLYQDFRGHGSPRDACGDAAPDTDDTWIQYPGEPNINSTLPSDVRQRLGIPDAQMFGDCFHPNDKGAEAYARAVDAAARSLGR